MREVLFVFLGMIVGVIPGWLARKRRLRTHWCAVRVEILQCNDLAETIFSDHRGRIKASASSSIHFTIGPRSSPPVDASAMRNGRSISVRCLPARRSASRKSASAFGSSALWTMTWVTLTTRRAAWNRSRIPFGGKCYPCARNEMSPV